MTEELLRHVDDGLIFTNLVETDSLWGHRNDPVNFHRCLQDFDRRLPDLLDALRPGDLLILTSDHGCDPTTPSTDHSREHALLLAYVEGRNAAGGSWRTASSPTSARRSTRGSAASRPARRARDVVPGVVTIRPAELIQRKRDGHELSAEEMSELVLGYARGEVPDYQMAAFCMAVYFKGLSSAETFALTDAMIRSGETIDLSAALGRKVVDKHSTGGVGDKTSLAVGPIVAACGVPFGKMSGRGLGHTGRHARQARVDPGLPHRADDRRVHRAGGGGRAGDRRADGRSRAGRQAALRPAGRHGDGRPDLADRGVDHVEEARGGRAGDRARREGRRRRVHEDARGCAAARRGDAVARDARRAGGGLPAHRHGSAARGGGGQRARGARGARDRARQRPGGLHRARARRERAAARALGSRRSTRPRAAGEPRRRSPTARPRRPGGGGSRRRVAPPTRTRSR